MSQYRPYTSVSILIAGIMAKTYGFRPSVSDTGQTFQDNTAVMKALVTKYPELRDAFGGVVARGVESSGKDYGTMMPMSGLK